MQGRAFSHTEIQRIAELLSETDMTIPEIAARMGCSRSAVIVINRKWKVRSYDGLKSKWHKFESGRSPRDTGGDESTNAA